MKKLKKYGVCAVLTFIGLLAGLNADIIIPIFSNFSNDLEIKDLTLIAPNTIKRNLNDQNLIESSYTSKCNDQNNFGIDLEFSLYNTNEFEILIESIQIEVKDYYFDKYIFTGQRDKMSETNYCCELSGVKSSFKCFAYQIPFSTIKSGNFERIKLNINSAVQGTYEIGVRILYRGHNVNWNDETIIIKQKLHYYDI